MPITPGQRSWERSPRANRRDRPNSGGDATRSLLLKKAEELFALRGIAAVPLRDIGVAAGQKNNVVVQYHFGDRESLIREIVTYRAKVSEEMRAELLADIFYEGRSPQVHDLVQVWLSALACHLDDDNYYLAFLSRYVIERGGYDGLEGVRIGNTYTAFTFVTMLRRLLPSHPRRVLEERWMVMLTSAVHSLARYQATLRSGAVMAPLPDLITDLVSFFTAALTVAPPALAIPGEPPPVR